MAATAIREFPRALTAPARILAHQAVTRALGAPLVAGNRVQILKDATENYPAWLDAIRSAKHSIFFENYFVHADGTGQQFAEALAAKAEEGVCVRVIHDWMGSLGKASTEFWRPLRDAGVEVRCFSPPRMANPLGCLRRDHRKMLCMDGRVGFVAGLCVGSPWVGDSAQGIEPWRDTGLMIEGPAVGDLVSAFADMWKIIGPTAVEAELLKSEWTSLEPAGDVALRVVATQPNTGGLYRFDQLIATLAKRSIWLTDAYFLGTVPYMNSLGAAAADGVDVRLLVPRSSDLPIVRTLSRTGYRALLESGVRLFEWNGPMLHAKTAVADGRWSRIGSSNLNLASWMGNWEMDVVVEDEAFAEEMEEMYMKDLSNSTEIVLNDKKIRPAQFPLRRTRRTKFAQGSTRRAVAGLLQVGNTVEAVVSNRRSLGPAETLAMMSAAGLLLLMALICVLWPVAIAAVIVVIGVWLAVSLLVRVVGIHIRLKKQEK